MTKFTKERLEQLANFRGAPVTRQEEQELARIALASLEAEPVAWAHRLKKKTVEMPTFDGYVPHVARELQAAFRIACDNAGINVAAAGKGE